MKKNKGFSLVELIVVMAIMAVLVGILAPSLLRYVEKARIQKDESAIGELVNELYLAASDLDNYEVLTTAKNNGACIQYDYDVSSSSLVILKADGSNANSFTNEIASVVGNSVKLESNTWRNQNIYVKIDPTWDTIVVIGNMPADSHVVVKDPNETE